MGEYDITTGYLFRQFPDDFVKFIAGDTATDITLADPVPSLRSRASSEADTICRCDCLRYD